MLVQLSKFLSFYTSKIVVVLSVLYPIQVMTVTLDVGIELEIVANFIRKTA